jgi:UDP-N-acetylglucosamine:LPS N-acetylglucosamine transferase
LIINRLEQEPFLKQKALYKGKDWRKFNKQQPIGITKKLLAAIFMVKCILSPHKKVIIVKMGAAPATVEIRIFDLNSAGKRFLTIV